MRKNSNDNLLTLSDANSIVKGMLFASEYLVYSDFELLKFNSEKIHVGFVGMVYVTKGRLTLRLNDADVLVKKGEIMLIKKDDYLAEPMFSIDCDGWIFLTSEIPTIAYKDSRTLSNLYALQANRRVFEVTEGIGKLIVLYGRFATEKYLLGYYDIRFTFISLANDIIQNLLSRQLADTTEEPTAATNYKKFNALLIETFPKPREVKWYAQRLGVTPKYLTVIVKRFSDRCVSEWIEEAVLADIRRLMIHTDYSMKEIAAAAGFNNSAFFGKYVKHRTGMTPMQLRNHLRKHKD